MIFNASGDILSSCAMMLFSLQWKGEICFFLADQANSGRMKILLLLTLLTQFLIALEIRSYSATRHDRFLNFPTAPTPNPGFFHVGTDLTGVGWYVAVANTAVEFRRQFTMVSPKHFVGAFHFRPATNGSIQFVTADGVVRTYAIGSILTIPNEEGDPSDLFIGTLESEIPTSDGIRFQPYLAVAEAEYLGQELIFLGHRNMSGIVTHRAGRAVLQARSQFGQGTAIGADTSIKKTEVFTWVYQDHSLILVGHPDDSHVQSGDSGSPSLVDVDGRGALVGIHTAIGTATMGFRTEVTSYDTFVPFYVDELNAKMAVEGYHMTRAVPGMSKPSTILTVSAEMPAVIRAGYPTSFPVTVANVGLLEDANNLKFSQTLPASGGTSLTGSTWVASGSGSLPGARKGGLSRNTDSSLTLSFTPAAPGRFVSEVTFSADEFEEATAEIELEVIESYLSWSSTLTDGGQGSDPDGDGIPNLHEYSFGGDPESISLVQASSGERLLPMVTESPTGVVVSFLRRTDAEDRALVYQVESSSNLAEGSWSPAAGMMGEGSPRSVDSDFERVSLEFPNTSGARFFRLKVTLDE